MVPLMITMIDITATTLMMMMITVIIYKVSNPGGMDTVNAAIAEKMETVKYPHQDHPHHQVHHYHHDHPYPHHHAHHNDHSHHYYDDNDQFKGESGRLADSGSCCCTKHSLRQVDMIS